MKMTRRAFLKHCVACAGAIGLAPLGIQRLEAALASKAAPTIIWLHGSGCQGDSVSFLNRIDLTADAGQQTVDDLLIHSIDLAYHTVVMASAGETAVGMVKEAQQQRPVHSRPRGRRAESVRRICLPGLVLRGPGGHLRAGRHGPRRRRPSHRVHRDMCLLRRHSALAARIRRTWSASKRPPARASSISPAARPTRTGSRGPIVQLILGNPIELDVYHPPHRSLRPQSARALSPSRQRLRHEFRPGQPVRCSISAAEARRPPAIAPAASGTTA